MLKAQFVLTNLIEDLRMRVEDETGAIPVEHLGILMFAAAVVVAVMNLPIGTANSTAVTNAVNSVVNDTVGNPVGG